MSDTQIIPVRMVDITNRIREEAPDLIERLSYHDIDRLDKAFSVFKHGEQESACRAALAELVRFYDEVPRSGTVGEVREQHQKHKEAWAAARAALAGAEQ